MKNNADALFFTPVLMPRAAQAPVIASEKPVPGFPLAVAALTSGMGGMNG